MERMKCWVDSIGAVVLLAKDGTAPYQFKLLNGSFQSDSVFSGLRGGTQTFIVADTAGCLASTNVMIAEPTTLFTPIVTFTNPVCNGLPGGAVLSVTGGNQPYYSQLDTNVYGTQTSYTGLNTGYHMIKVKDANNCERSFSGSIVEPPVLLASTTDVQPLCYGEKSGSISIQGIGGVPPYRYRLNGGTFSSNGQFTNLAAGSYSYELKDTAGCSFSQNRTLNYINPKINTSFSTTAPTCSNMTNGSAIVSITGGTPPFQVSWQTKPQQNGLVATQLPSGYTRISITDSKNCTIVDSALLAVSPTIPRFETLCGITVDTVTGRNNILWNKVYGAKISSYKVFANLPSGQSLIGSAAFTDPSRIIDTVASHAKQPTPYYLQSIDSCGNTSAWLPANVFTNIKLQASHLGTGNTLSWNNVGGSINGSSYVVYRSLNGAPYVNVKQLPLTTLNWTDSFPSTGNVFYFVELVLSSGGCSIGSTTYHIYSSVADPNATGIDEFNQGANDLQVFPNPTNGLINVQSQRNGNRIVSIEVLNVLGSTIKVKDFPGTEQKVEMDLSDLSAGLYQIIVSTVSGLRYAQKVILGKIE